MAICVLKLHGLELFGHCMEIMKDMKPPISNHFQAITSVVMVAAGNSRVDTFFLCRQGCASLSCTYRFLVTDPCSISY